MKKLNRSRKYLEAFFVTRKPRASGWRIAVSLFIFFVGLTVSLPGQDIPVTGKASPGMESYDRVMMKLMQKWEIPGMSVAVAKNGKIILAKGYGWADKSKRQPVQADSVFRLASLSKTFTAAAIMKLVEEKKLNLDTPVFQILSNLKPPRGQTPDPRIGKITVRHVLHHAGGWDEKESFDPMFRTRMIAESFGTTSPANTSQIIQYMLGQPLQFDPGSRYAYSNFGYCVLGRVIEKVTGQTYESYVQSAILRPCGIFGMRIGRSLLSGKSPKEVTYYTPEGSGLAQSVFDSARGEVPWPYGGWSLEVMDAHGGWIGSAIDILTFLLKIDGRASVPDILRRESVQMLTAHPPKPLYEGSEFWYAMGLLVRPSRGDANWWHMGSLDGTTTIMVRSFQDICWVALCNFRPADFGTMDGELDNAMWEALNGVKW